MHLTHLFMEHVHIHEYRIKIEIEEDALNEFIKRNFPDMRKIYNKIQYWKDLGIKHIKIGDIKKLNWSFSELFELIVTEDNLR